MLLSLFLDHLYHRRRILEVMSILSGDGDLRPGNACVTAAKLGRREGKFCPRSNTGNLAANNEDVVVLVRQLATLPADFGRACADFGAVVVVGLLVFALDDL